MKKRAKKIISFVLIFCILFSIANVLVVEVDAMGYKMITEFYSQPKNSLDGVYIGASNGFAYWNSLFAWNEYGICVYPYCCNSNPYYSTEYIIKEARKTQPNATFIVNLNSLTDGELDGPHMYNIINSMPFSKTKLELIDHLCNIGDYEGLDRVEYYFPFIRFHSRWANFYSGNKLTSRPNGYKGSSTHDTYLETCSDVSSIYTTPSKTIELSEKLIYSTDLLLDYCEKENISVTFVVVPQAREEEYDINRMDTLADYISSKGYPVLNLIETAEEEFNLDTTKDFYNGAHTNIHGSIKYTYYISEYLIENYGFKDKRNNKAYADWDSSYESYMKVASPHVLDIELDHEHRDFSIEEPVFNVKTKNNTAKITWEPVENADGYKIYKKSSDTSPWKCLSEVSAKSDTLKYTDKDVSKETTYYYTIVPFTTQNGSNYYGDFNYSGVSIEL